MDEKDKQILKDSALVIADQIASNIPGLNIAWGLSKALYGVGLRLREQKALEWVEMVRDNPSVFTQELLEQQEFQDGFVFALEKYLTERNEEKRKYNRNIFLGYATAGDKTEFPLEKFLHTLSQLNSADIAVLRDVDVSREDKNYQVYGESDKNLSNIYALINTGILHNDPSPRIGPITGPFVWVSEFGRAFIKYIKS